MLSISLLIKRIKRKLLADAHSYDNIIEMTRASGRRPTKRRRNRRPAAESRAALIAATTSLMASGAALTTGSIAAAAGLALPTFYAYFSSVEEIRVAAVQAVVERMEAAAAERRAEAGATPPDFERQVQSLVRWLETARAQGDIHSIYARFADEDSVVGETLRALGEINIARWSEELWRAAAAHGVGAQHYREVRVLALLYNAEIAALARAAHRNQLADLALAARVTVRSQWAAYYSFVTTCGGRIPPAPKGTTPARD